MFMLACMKYTEADEIKKTSRYNYLYSLLAICFMVIIIHHFEVYLQFHLQIKLFTSFSFKVQSLLGLLEFGTKEVVISCL